VHCEPLSPFFKVVHTEPEMETPSRHFSLKATAKSAAVLVVPIPVV